MNNNVIFRYKDGRIIPIKVDNLKSPSEYMNAKIRENRQKRINEHTLEYNGYYIMSAKPNVGYEYKKLEESNYFSIYDKNDDDITHNLANWITSINDAKKYIDDMKKWKIFK